LTESGSAAPRATARRSGRSCYHAALQLLTGIESPTLIIQGDADLMIPTKLSYLMAGLISDARIRIYPDSAHGFLFPYPDRGRG
jgi:pimeloyl-ACP methyl ester carboxylesterase